MNSIQAKAEEIFPLGKYDLHTPNEHYNLRQTAYDIISTYGWNNVFPCWREYLYNKCKTYDDVMSFATTLLYILECKPDMDYLIDNPYEFLGYIYYRVGSKRVDYESILNPLTYDILINCAGRSDLEDMYDSWYTPLDDHWITDEIAKWKEKLG